MDYYSCMTGMMVRIVVYGAVMHQMIWQGCVPKPTSMGYPLIFGCCNNINACNAFITFKTTQAMYFHNQ